MSQDIRLYGAAEVWDQPLQAGQRNLLQAIVDFWPSGIDSVLDVGCGDGKLTSRLQAQGMSTLMGLDSSAEALSRLPFAGVLGTAEALPFANGAFDLVMSTDALEHIPDQQEAQAWPELFRVADKVVMVAVPFQEELMDAMARCSACSHLYHVNWHQRSYAVADLHRRCPPGWHVGATVLAGEPWSAMLPPETRLRREVFNQWSGWDLAICPFCSTGGQAPDELQPLPSLFAQALAAHLYPALRERRYCRSHSEILVIFQRDGCRSALPSPRLSEPVVQAASRLDFVMQQAAANLLPYCQVAQYVMAEEGQRRVQFPLYEDDPVLDVRRLPGSAGDLHLLLEDAQGVLFDGCVLRDGEEQHVLTLPRSPVAGYYGILASCPTHEPFACLQLGQAPTVLWNAKPDHESCRYLPVSSSVSPVFVQVAQPLWFDPQTLIEPVAAVVPSCAQVLASAQQCFEQVAKSATSGSLLQEQAASLDELRIQVQNLAVENQTL